MDHFPTSTEVLLGLQKKNKELTAHVEAIEEEVLELRRQLKQYYGKDTVVVFHEECDIKFFHVKGQNLSDLNDCWIDWVGEDWGEHRRQMEARKQARLASIIFDAIGEYQHEAVHNRRATELVRGGAKLITAGQL